MAQVHGGRRVRRGAPAQDLHPFDGIWRTKKGRKEHIFKGRVFSAQRTRVLGGFESELLQEGTEIEFMHYD